MKSLLVFVCMTLPLFNASFGGPQKTNEVYGSIEMVDCPKFFVAGKYNKDGTEIMISDDPMILPNRNVFVSVHPLDFKPELELTEDAYFSQSQQSFIPHTIGVVVGSQVHFLNEDEFFHNVQSYTPKSRFSIGRRAPGISYSVDIKKTGTIDLTCDIHPHMKARILSFSTPFFTRVLEDGTYRIDNLPDGRYYIEVDHPNCEKISKNVELKGGISHELNFSFKNKP